MLAETKAEKECDSAVAVRIESDLGNAWAQSLVPSQLGLTRMSLGEIAAFIKKATARFQFSEPFNGHNFLKLQGELRAALDVGLDEPSVHSDIVTIKMLAELREILHGQAKQNNFSEACLTVGELYWQCTRPCHFAVLNSNTKLLRSVRTLVGDTKYSVGVPTPRETQAIVEFCKHVETIIDAKSRPSKKSFSVWSWFRP